MKQVKTSFVHGFVLVSLAICLFEPLQTSAIEASDEKSKTESNVVGSVPRINKWTIHNYCKGASVEPFDPTCLSTASSNLVFDVIIAPSGIPSYKVVKSTDSDDLDVFYCEQSIWEGAPAISEQITNFEGSSFTCNFKSKPDSDVVFSRWKQMFPQTSRDFAVMHFVPLSLYRRCVTLPWMEFDAPSNIVRIKAAMLKSSLLHEFRVEWVSFINCRATIPEPESRKKIDEMRKKYASLFDKK